MPSEVFFIDSEWVNFLFDRAVRMFGDYVDNRLQEYDKKYKPKWTLDEVLSGKPLRPKQTISALLFMGDKDEITI